VASLFQGVMDAGHGALDSVFGVAVTHTPAAGGGPYTRRGIFDRAPEPIGEGTEGVPVSATAPTLSIVLADWAVAPVQGDSLVVSGVTETWRVDDVRPDGSGAALLVLAV
jgi:hypothetical protein